MGCRAGPDVLEKRNSVASAGNPTLDRRPARSIVAMLMVEILKAFIQARIMTAIWVIIISSTCRSTPRGTSETCTERSGRLRLRTTAWHQAMSRERVFVC